MDLQHVEDVERDFCDPSKTERSEVTLNCRCYLSFRAAHRCSDFQWLRSADRLHDDDSRVAARSASLLCEKAAFLHLTVVLQGGRGSGCSTHSW